MYLVLGVVFLSAAALLFAWAYVALRRARPPAWAKHNQLIALVSVAFAGLFVIGFGYLATGLLGPVESLASLTPASAVVALAIAALSATSVVVLLRSRERQAPPPAPPAMEGQGA